MIEFAGSATGRAFESPNGSEAQDYRQLQHVVLGTPQRGSPMDATLAGPPPRGENLAKHQSCHKTVLFCECHADMSK